MNQFLSFCGTTHVSNWVFSSAVNQNDDAYIKDFIDLIEKEPDVADKLGIFKVVYVRNSDKVNLPKTQSNGFKCKQILGVAPDDCENNADYRKAWADKIINYLNTQITWTYSNVFKFRADLTRVSDNSVVSCLDECLLDKDIGAFIGLLFQNDQSKVIHNELIMKTIFGNNENLVCGETILLTNWDNWVDTKDV